MRIRLLCPLLIVAGSLATSGCAARGASSNDASSGPTDDATVAKVIDGDTISVTRDGHDTTVRLIGIDTPETKRPNAAVECFGPEAHHRLAALLPPGTQVRLEHDLERHDRYDRELAYVRRAADGLFVNAAMVRDGYAGVLVFRPNVRHEAELGRAVDEARLTRRGLWSACGSPHRVAT